MTKRWWLIGLACLLLAGGLVFVARGHDQGKGPGPDVTQAQALSDVQGSVSKARVDFRHVDQDFLQQEALYKEGLISVKAYRKARVDRDLAEETLKAALSRYQIVEDRGIPISGNAGTQLARVAAPMDGVLEVALDQLADCFRTGMSANVEILGEKRDQAVSVPLEALQRRDGATVVYRLKRELSPGNLAAARQGLSGRSKFVWLAGLAVGVLFSWLITRVLGVPLAMGLASFVWAFLLALGFGFAFSLFPAWKASRLSPMEALRYE